MCVPDAGPLVRTSLLLAGDCLASCLPFILALVIEGEKK